MAEITLTNMVMIQDRHTGKVVAQKREKSWKGIAFPGGHVEPGESFAESAAREVLEETGLTVKNLVFCGMIHWCHKRTGERYLVYLYKTSDYSGELITETEEGEVFWVSPGELSALKLCDNFPLYLPMFFKGCYSEVFLPWEDDQPYEAQYIQNGQQRVER